MPPGILVSGTEGRYSSDSANVNGEEGVTGGDSTGVRLRSVDLGDASEDMQTTPDGKIWVRYFDTDFACAELGAPPEGRCILESDTQ